MVHGEAGEGEFWARVERLGGRVTEPGIDALVDDLVASGEASIIAFAEQLAAAVHALDTPEHLAQPVRDEGDPTALPLSPDVFRWARAAVVATGEKTWRHVLEDPAAFARTWPIEASIELLGVPARAWEQLTGELWDHETAVSTHTRTGLPTAPHPAGGGQEPPPWQDPWLNGAIATDVGVSPPPAYENTWMDLWEALPHDPRWIDWWEPAGRDELRLFGLINNGIQSPPTMPFAKVRRGRRAVEVEAVFDANELRGHRPDQQWRDLALEHTRYMLDAARDRLGLGPLPDFPEVEPTA